MAGVIFIVNVPKQEYEDQLKKDQTNLIFEKEKLEKASKLISELKEKHNNDKTPNVATKCNSTCSLDSTQELYLHKTKSDISLADGYLGKKSAGMWGDIRQAIKPRKNKLVINKPVRGVDILGAFHWNTPLETILSEVVSRLDIRNVAWSSTRDNKFWQVIFSLKSDKLCEELLQVLRTFGVGSRYQSTVSLVPCALYYKSEAEDGQPDSEIGKTKLSHGSDTSKLWSRFSLSVRERANLAQVLHDVHAGAALTFDWVLMLLIAAFVAAIGLVENSTVTLVASMLMSPLMRPITAGTLGTAAGDCALLRMGILNEMLGLLLALSVGFTVGLAVSILDVLYGIVDNLPNEEITSRCEYHSLWLGVLVALPTGAGVALAVLGDFTSSLAGAAISASLLPPAVNAGLLWAMALVRYLTPDDMPPSVEQSSSELAVMASSSLCLTFLNIVFIFLAGVAVYKVKAVSPLDSRDLSWWKENKDRLETLKEDQPDTSPSLNWDIYNTWCKETLDGKECVKKCSSPLQSDTVTYRRRPSAINCLRAHNIENYCFRKVQTGENYVPLDDTKTSLDQEQNQDASKINEAIQNTVNKLENTIDGEDLKLHRYYNVGFKSDEEPKHPTIEPSLSYTVDTKQFGVLLSSKTIHV